MPHNAKRTSAQIRPQWKGTEEARRLTDKEQMAHEIRMLTWTHADFLACWEDPPKVIRAKVKPDDD